MGRLNMHPGWCKGCAKKVESQHGQLLRDAKGWYVDCGGKALPAPASKVAAPGVVQAAKAVIGAALAAFTAWLATFKPSARQEAVAQALRGTEAHLIVQAVAGSGKTTLLRYLVSLLGGLGLDPRDVGVFAFNNKIAKELRSKLPESVNVQTCHAAGYALVRASVASRDVDWRSKLRQHLASEVYVRLWPCNAEEAGAVGMRGLGTDDYERSKLLQDSVVHLCMLARLRLENLAPDTGSDAPVTAIDGLCDRYGVEVAPTDVPEVARRVARLVEQLTREFQEQMLLDFTGQLYLPWALDLRPARPYALVLGDECQDWSAVQRSLVLRLAGPEGRIIAVGDERQAINGFAGADTESIPCLRAELGDTSRGVKELPLDVCFRCGTSALNLVRKLGLHDSILPRDGAPAGTVTRLAEKRDVDGWFAGLDRRSEALIVCRTNAPLVGRAFSLIRRGIPAKIEGRDLAGNLIATVKRVRYKSDGNDLDAFLARLRVYTEREVRKLVAAHKDAQAEQMTDKALTIEALADGCEGVDALLRRIDDVFADSDDGRAAPIRFSSIHRAKGLEAATVVVLEPQLLPHPMAKQDWEHIQEANLAYVALTRSNAELVICGRLGFEGQGGYDGPDGEDSEGEPASVHSAFEGLGRVSLPARSAHACADVSEDEHEAALAAQAAFQAAADAEDEYESLAYFQARPLPPEAPAEPATPPSPAPVPVSTPPAPAAPLAPLPTPTAAGDGAYVGCTREEWDALADAYADVGCEAWLEVPERWHQWALVVRRCGVTVRCSTTIDVTGAGASRVKGANAIDIVCVGRVGPATRVLRTSGWLGRVARKVNEMLEGR